MRISSATANHKLPSEELARGCLTTNLAVPGLGSVMGGRKIGYLQLVLCIVGLAITMVCGIRFITWSLAHWTETHQQNYEDPLAPLRLILRQVVWPLSGMLLFAISWIWSMVTSYAMLREAKANKLST